MQPAFQFQQELFGLEAACIAGEQTVGTHHPVARHEDGEGIGAIGVGHGTHGCGTAQLPGLLDVGASLSVGDAQQAVPRGLLEFCPGKEQGHGERRAPGVEVFVQLACGFLRDFRRALRVAGLQKALQPAVYPFGVLRSSPIAQAEPIAERTERQFAAGRQVAAGPYFA